MDVSGHSDPQAEADRLVATLAATPFDLAGDPLLRVRLFRISDSEHLLCLVLHHIAADGWSMAVLVDELCQLYNAMVAGGTPSLPSLPMTYRDHASQQQKRADGGDEETGLEYWRDRLRGANPLRSLPVDRKPPAEVSFDAGVETFEIDAATTAELRRMSRQHRVSPFTVLLATFHALLARYTDSDDVVVGVPVAGRSRSELEHLIGMFVNVVPVRVSLGPRLSFAEFLERVRDAMLGAQVHSDVPAARIAQCVVTLHHTTTTGPHLVAYTVPTTGHTIDPHQLRHHLTHHLPAHMLPTICPIDHIPLTPHGKIDHTRLPTPTRGATPARTTRPTTARTTAR